MSTSPLDDIDPDREFDRAAWIQGKQAAHEDRVVRFLLSALDKPGLIPQLRHRGLELSDSKLLHFGLFNEAVPDFPIWLGARHIPFVVKDLTLWNVQRRFTKLRTWEGYLDVKSDVPSGWDGPVGMIFRCAKVQGGYGAMILHDAPCILKDFWFQKKVHDAVYTIERLVTFAFRLKAEAC